MTDTRTSIVLRRIRTLLPALLWLGTAVLMWQDWLQDPYDPTLTGTRAYGHNADGDLTLGLVVSLAELVAYYGFTRPWVRRRSGWLALLLALGVTLFVPWTLLQTVFLMHAGGIQAIHVLWLWALGALLMVEAGRAIQAALRGPPRGR
jgi:arginine exporter protein ArgO